MFGGRGVYRTFLGVIFVSVLTNILVLSGISFGYQQVALGVLIVLAVSWMPSHARWPSDE